jgi:single-stranded DNA-specific DHH superfamily exonuclease
LGEDVGKSGAEPNLKQHLDLVVVATAADMVPLTGDNRALVKHGMDRG